MIYTDKIKMSIRDFYIRRQHQRQENAYLEQRKEEERDNRIFILIYTYSVEIHGFPIIDLRELYECLLDVDPSLKTGEDDDDIIDVFFRTHFDPCTLSWIHQYPDLDTIYQMYWEMIDDDS